MGELSDKQRDAMTAWWARLTEEQRDEYRRMRRGDRLTEEQYASIFDAVSGGAVAGGWGDGEPNDLRLMPRLLNFIAEQE